MKHFISLLIIVVFSSPALAGKGKIAIGHIKYCASEASQTPSYAAYTRAAKEGTAAFTNMLTTALSKTNKFDVIEYDDVANTLRKQNLTIEKFISRLSQNRGVELEGLDYILTGSITEFGEFEKTTTLIAFKTNTRIATMAADIRIIDIRDGAVVVAETVRLTGKSGSTLQLENYKDSRDNQGRLLGQVMRATSNEAVRRIVSNLYPIKVVAKQSKYVMLNYGDSLLSKGNILDIFSQGETFVDPDTGEVLGSEERQIGSVKVVSTQPKLSKAEVLYGGSNIQKGMLARLVKKKPDSK